MLGAKTGRGERPRPRRYVYSIPLFVVLTALAGCGEKDTTGPGDPDNVSPTVAPIADRTVVRNAVSPRSIDVELAIQDPDDASFAVTVISGDDAIIPGTTFTCAPVACSFRLDPVADASAEVTITVTVSDGRGGEAQTGFVVRIAPRLVTTNADDGAGSLRGAIAGAEAGDVIGFDTDGAFGTPQTIVLAGQLVLERDVTIEGPGAPGLTVSGDSAVRVFKVVEGADVILRNLTIADGLAPLEAIDFGVSTLSGRLGGGAFVGTGGKLTLIEAIVTRNRVAGLSDVTAGGGLANLGGTLVLVDSEVIGNWASDGGGGIFTSVDSTTTTVDGGAIVDNGTPGSGGGVAAAAGAVVRLRATTIARNVALSGGGVMVGTTGTVALENNTSVTGNEATGGGGGIGIFRGIAAVTGSTIAGNTAAEGGGIYNDRGDLSIQGSSRIEDNRAENGGGIYVQEPVPSADISIFAPSVVVANMANTDGGGVYVAGGTLTVVGTACVILDNVADFDGDGTGTGGGIYSAGGNISGVDAAQVCSNGPDDIAP
jgi:hypothetical protein